MCAIAKWSDYKEFHNISAHSMSCMRNSNTYDFNFEKHSTKFLWTMFNYFFFINYRIPPQSEEKNMRHMIHKKKNIIKYF